jgi:hypothetical protein
MTGVHMVHVPYRGSAPALTDLLAGQVQLSFDTIPSLIEYVRANRLRALAVSTATRSEALPDIPLGGIRFVGSASDFKNHIAQETEKWAKVIKFAGIKPD